MYLTGTKINPVFSCTHVRECYFLLGQYLILVSISLLYMTARDTPAAPLLVDTDPDMTTLVTLEVQSPGGNDSVSLVPVRIRCNFILVARACHWSKSGAIFIFLFIFPLKLSLKSRSDPPCIVDFSLFYASGTKNLKYLVGTGESGFTVYNPDTSGNTSGNFYCTAFFSLFYVSGTKNLQYTVGIGDNSFKVYNSDISGIFYYTTYFSLFYEPGTKNLKHLVRTGENILTVYNPNTPSYLISPSVSGTKNLKYTVGTGDNTFIIRNPDTSGNVYCNVPSSLFYVPGSKKQSL